MRYRLMLGAALVAVACPLWAQDVAPLNREQCQKVLAVASAGLSESQLAADKMAAVYEGVMGPQPTDSGPVWELQKGVVDAWLAIMDSVLDDCRAALDIVR